MFNLDMLIGLFSFKLPTKDNNVENTTLEQIETKSEIDFTESYSNEIPEGFFDSKPPKTNLEIDTNIPNKMREYVKYCDEPTRDVFRVVEKHLDKLKEKCNKRYNKTHKEDANEFDFDIGELS